jgi:hypothetical protein
MIKKKIDIASAGVAATAIIKMSRVSYFMAASLF